MAILKSGTMTVYENYVDRKNQGAIDVEVVAKDKPATIEMTPAQKAQATRKANIEKKKLEGK